MSSSADQLATPPDTTDQTPSNLEGSEPSSSPNLSDGGEDVTPDASGVRFCDLTLVERGVRVVRQS
jgi:hypothetical protein